MASAEFDPAGFAAFLGSYAEVARSLDFRRSLKVIAVLVKADVKERFQTSTAPDGTPWLPLKRRRRGKRHKKATKDKPLLDTGLLQASISANGQNHIEDITEDSLTVGSSLHYAGYQNFGTRHIPAREFAGFSPKVLTEIEEVLAEYVLDQLR